MMYNIYIAVKKLNTSFQIISRCLKNIKVSSSTSLSNNYLSLLLSSQFIFNYLIFTHITNYDYSRCMSLEYVVCLQVLAFNITRNVHFLLNKFSIFLFIEFRKYSTICIKIRIYMYYLCICTDIHCLNNVSCLFILYCIFFSL
jgi:hypothetical protein